MKKEFLTAISDQIVDEVDAAFITLMLDIHPGCIVVESGIRFILDEGYFLIYDNRNWIWMYDPVISTCCLSIWSHFVLF
jgi:hypothetical protein